MGDRKLMLTIKVVGGDVIVGVTWRRGLEGASSEKTASSMLASLPLYAAVASSGEIKNGSF